MFEKWSPLTPAPFQRRLAAAVAPGRNLTTAVTMARGNAKTWLMALAAAEELTEQGGEVILVAASFKQAQIAFYDVLAALRFRFGENLKPRFRVEDSTNLCRVRDRKSGGDLRCISAKVETALGLRPSLILGDEPAAWPQGERMAAALQTSLGKKPGSRMVIAGTRPPESTHFFARLLDGDDPDVAVIRYEADPDPAKQFHIRNIRKANPLIDFGSPSRRQIDYEVRQARRDKLALVSFRNFRLNLGEAEATARRLLISAEEWAAARQRPLGAARPPMVWGVDLGGARSLCSVAAYWPGTGRLDSLSMVGGLPSLSERGSRDGVGNLYQAAAAEGGLLVDDGRHLPDPRLLIGAALREWGTPHLVVSDHYRKAELADIARHYAFSWHLTSGGSKGEGPEMVARFRKALLDGTVNIVPRRLLDWAAPRMYTRQAFSGDWILDMKKADGGGAQDDPIAAAVLAVGIGERMVRAA